MLEISSVNGTPLLRFKMACSHWEYTVRYIILYEEYVWCVHVLKIMHSIRHLFPLRICICHHTYPPFISRTYLKLLKTYCQSAHHTTHPRESTPLCLYYMCIYFGGIIYGIIRIILVCMPCTVALHMHLLFKLDRILSYASKTTAAVNMVCAWCICNCVLAFCVR